MSGRMSNTELHGGGGNGNQDINDLGGGSNHNGGDYDVAALSLSPNSVKDSQMSPHAKKFTLSNDEDRPLRDPFDLGIVRPAQ